MSARRIELTVPPGSGGVRVDRFIASNAEGVSRSAASRLVEGGCVYSSLAGKIEKPSCAVSEGESVTVFVPEPKRLEAEPENIELDIVYEDSDIALVNKPTGMVVHPAAGHSGGTLVNAMLHHAKDLSSIGGTIRPGIVHRLDRDTSGLILVAKNDAAHQGLSDQFKGRSVKKTYYAIVCGQIAKAKFTVNLPIGRSDADRKKMAVVTAAGRGARGAVTLFETARVAKGFSLVVARPETGRTHQIRVHLAHVGFPIAGDRIYLPEGLKKNLASRGAAMERLWLHAEGLAFTHPATGEKLEFHTGVPDEFDNFFKNL